MKIPFSPPDIGEQEIQAVTEALRSGWITTGPKTKEFERKIAAFCGTEKAVCLNSQTACAEMTLRALGVGAGDEVITSAYTYTASASVICHVGATPVLIDTAPGSYEMDYCKLEEAITEKTKVIIPVDIAGVPCDYEKIFQIVERKKGLFRPSENPLQKAFGRIIVQADGAHSFGASRNGIPSGSLADFTCFSFHAVKNLTTAEGGAVVWKEREGIDSEDLYRLYMLLSLHGQSKDALAKTQLGAWEYDIVAPYYKCNMTDIMGSLGLVQLERYSSLLARRREIIQIYTQELQGLPVEILVHESPAYISSKHLFLVRLTGKTEQQRNQIITKMAQAGIATNVHYKPLPMHTAYKNLGFRIEDYPNAYQMYHNEITLPLHTLLTDQDAHFVASTLRSILEETQ